MPQQRARTSAKGWSSSPAHLKPSSRSVPRAPEPCRPWAQGSLFVVTGGPLASSSLRRHHQAFFGGTSISLPATYRSQTHPVVHLQAVPSAWSPPFPLSLGKVGCLSVPSSDGTSWTIADSAMALRMDVSDSFGYEGINMGCKGKQHGMVGALFFCLFLSLFFPPLGK